MINDHLAEVLKKQKSLTEWLEDIGHQNVDTLRREDNEKRVRLKVLHNTIGLPFDDPIQFPASAIADNTPEFQAYLQQHGTEFCALRLLPKQPNLPKLRIRGKTIVESVTWFFEQKVDASQYLADFVPHIPSTRSTIFVVNEHGIQGEVIEGLHHQLTQGFHETNTPHVFRYDFADWGIAPASDKLLTYLQGTAQHLHVPDKAQQAELTQKLGASFTHNYIKGYFETTESAEFGTWFIDYSPSLGDMYADLVLSTTAPTGNALVHGQPGATGTATGPVRIVEPHELGGDFPEGGILVCKVTTPDHIRFMQKAAAIVTDQGGILSHAAIVARELKVPCIVGTGNATSALKNGQIVTVDATKGDVHLA